MSRATGHPAPPASVSRPRPSRRRAASLSVVALALILAFLAAYAPALLGRWILLRVTEDVQAASISGPLWRPVLHSTQVQLPGITAQAKQLGVGVAGFDLGRRVMYVNVDLRGAEVALDMAELFGQGEDAITTEEGWKVQLRSLTVSDTALKVNGAAANVPNGTFEVTQARDGGLLAQGQTADGDISAHLRFRQGTGGTEYVTQFQADARVLRHYWEGVDSGILTGEYVFGQGPVRGNVRLTDGRIQVPEAGWAVVEHISGTATHSGDLIDVSLSGEGYGKPVTASVNVNMAAEQWQARLSGTPQLAKLAGALGTGGEGEARLSAYAHSLGRGWKGVEVVAQANSTRGTLAGIPFERLANEYRYLDRDGDSQTRPELNRWRLGADTTLLGEQRLSGEWNFGGTGGLHWRGALLDAPLDLSASIARETLEGRPADFATITGTALGGPAQGRVALSGRVIEVRLNPELDSLSGALALSGQAGDLRLSAQGLNAAGFALDGEARFSEAGTTAQIRQPDGGRFSLNLNSDWKGRWTAQELRGNGVTLSGQGALDVPAAQLSGQLGLSSGLLERTLSGPLNLNWDTRQARWDAGGQSLRWSGERLLADLRGLRLNSGIRLDGSLNAALDLSDLRGTLRGQGEGFSVTATGEGDRVRWQGSLGQGRRSVALGGLTRLDEDFATAVTLSGADVSADVRVRNGLSFDFDLRTADERASGTIEGENWDAQGRVNLGALRPVLNGVLGPDSPLADLSGTLDLNLSGQSGTARVQARAAGAALTGSLRRQGGAVTAERLQASGGTGGPLAGFQATASGEVYPRVNLRGPVTLGPLGGVQGLDGQVLQGRLYGSYGTLNAALNGQTAPLSAGGASLPAQTLALGGRLTPSLDLSGRWGGLDLRYRSGLFSVSGTQALTVQGRAATGRGRASWGQGQAGQSWQGQADLTGSTADGYALAVRGPWNALRVTASHPDGLRAAGTVNAPRQSYDLAVSGRAPLFGSRSFGVQGRVRGQGLNPRGTLTLTDGQGGRAFLTLNGLDNLTVRAEALRLGGQTLSGDLRSVDGLADGQLTTSAHGQTLTLQATRGRVNVSGVVQNHRVQASGQLRLPGAGGALRLSGLRLNVNGPYLAAQAAGSLQSLRGQVTLKAQQFGEGDAVLILPQQTLPLSASLTPLRATVGGLTYAGGRWSGNASLSYLVRTRGAQAQAARGGQVQLRGSGQGLTALSSGALAGRVALLPTVGGTLSADTALLRPLLPAELQDLRGGRVQATFTAQGARLSTPGVRYRGQALSLSAQVDWGRGFSPGTLQASGVLATGRSRLPFQLRGGALTLTGARVDARDVQPLLGTALSGTGQPLPTGASFRGNLFVPDIGDFSLNTLGVRGVLTSGHSQAPLTLRGGTLTLEDALLDVRDVRPFVPAATRLPADGTFRGDLRLTDLAHFSLANVQAQGVLASGRSRAPLSLRRGALRVTGGVLDVRDLRPLVDDPASLPAGGTFQGDLYVPDLNKFDLQHVRARGVLASGASRLPLDIRNDTLRVSGGVLNVNDVRRWLDPELREKLPGSATFRGDLTLRNLGDFAPENLNVRGVLNVGNSRLPLTLAGRALTVTGGRLDLADVQPYLDLPARGVLRGDLYLPDVLNPDLNTVRADLVTGGLTATNLVDTSAQGRLRLRGGQLWADLSGQVQGQPLTLRGDVYPRANATLRSEELTARLSGHAEGTLNFSAAGEYQGRAVAVQGTLNGLLAEGRAARAALSGTVSGAQLDLTLNEASTAWEDWRVSGSLLVPDARTLDPGLSGSLSGSVGGTLGRADLRVQGTVNDIALNVPATFSGGELRVREAQAGSAELGTATLSGLAFPRLNLSGAAQLRGDLAGSYRLNVSGDYSAPTARLDGQLAGESGSVHPSGLNIGGTGVTATLQEGRWQAQLSGPAVRGTVSGVLGAQVAGQDTPLGLQRADLNLNARYRRDGDDLTLSGPLAWNGAAGTAGWRGNVNVRGTLGGERLSAQATGTGPLSVTARLGDASLRAELGRLAPVRPEGWVATERWDVGALWGRPEQLRLTGRADLAGPDWQSVQARLSGQLDDVTGELSGTLSGEWTQAQGGTFALSGPRVQANGTLRGGRYTVDARLGEGPQGTQVGLARLLPAEWGITALKASGSLSARGSLTGGVEQLDASGLEVNGEQQGAGPFTLYGRASYRPQQETLDAALAGGYGGGIFRIGGSLPQGLNVQVANVSLAAFASENFDPGRLNGEATLRGPLSRAALSGTLHTTGGNVDAAVDLLGRLDDPRVQARLNLRGEQSGELTLSARDFDLPGRTFAGELRGQVRQGDTVADLDLRGQWPRLGGQVRVQDPELAQPVTLRGQHGQFTLDPGVAGAGSGSVTLAPGAGWLPTLTAQADLNPLALLPGASGEARLRLNAGGELNALTVQGTLSAPAATLAGVTVRDLNGTFGGPLNGGLTGLSGELTQRGQAVGTLAGGRLNLSGLRAEAAGSTLALSGPVALDTLNAALTADVSGSLSGELRLNYAGGRLSSSGTLEGLGYRAALDVQGSQESGWSGTVTARDIQGAPEVLTTPATLTVSGPWNTPRLRGTLGLLNAAATLEASPDGAALTLADGVTAKGSGTLRVAPDPAGVWRWTGAASVDSPRLRLSVTPRGELADPLVGVAAGRGTWQATGSVSRAAGRLSVSDGERQGRLDWQGQVLSADLPGLDLAGLRWRGLAGRLSAQGTVNLGNAVNPGSDAVAGGALPFRIDGLRSPWRVDALNLPLSGDVSGTLQLVGGRPSVQAQAALGSEGTAQGQATLTATQQPGGKWFGRLQGRLQQGSGTLSADVRSDAAGLTGQVQATGYPVTLQEQTLALNGAARLNGQTFSADLNLDGVAGEASLSGGGSLGAALPALTGLTALEDTGAGYTLTGTLGGVDLGQLGLVPDLSGTVSGELDITDGAGQFVLRSADLNLAGEALPSRFEGVLVGQDWRIRGYLGDTDIFAGVSGGVLSGNAELQGLPLGAVANALAGQRLADGRVTGVARFEAPLADPLAGRATVVAERIRLTTLPSTEGGETAESETLTGSGSLDFQNRELRSINVQLGGAGSWDIRGQYTRERVDVRANFTETTFTPLLALIPSLAEQSPRLKGSLNVAVLGDYGQPVGTLDARNLRGSLAGVSLEVPALTGRLDQSGRWTLGGGVRTGGALDSAGTLQGSGLWRDWQLSESALNYSGQLSPGSAVGTLSGVQATLSQNRTDPERWVLDARSVSRNATTGQGLLEVRGQLIPAWDLSVRATNYDLALPGVFLRESALNGALTLRQDPGSEDIRVSGSADFARAVLGRPDAADNLDALVPSPEQPRSEDGDPDNFVSPLPKQYTTFPQPEAAADAGTEPAPPALPLLERLILEDIPVSFSGGIQLQESLAQAELGGSLRLSGTGARPHIAGHLSGQRGTLLLRDTEFALRNLDIDFSGTSPYPTFNLLAEGRVRPLTGGAAVPVTLDVQGSFLEDGAGGASLDLKTALRCTEQTAACNDPQTGQPYTESQLYALVLTGVPNVENLPENLGSLGASALNTALNVFVLGELSRNLADALGVDVLRFTPALVGEGGATITIGSQLTENLYLEYQVDLRGEGLINAAYNTPDGRFTFKVSTEFDFGESKGFRPSVSAGYNINERTSVAFNIENTSETNRFSVGVQYRLPSNFWKRER
ncbi:translocation/assembly module TamB domain-containing protein [Deinococcus sp. SL84]|uniref:translocation/assembly module TamB domain-containing protein n=1 Tax=Deinococcus sp. SL84 TaxID=2994663 RepID=UPI002275E2EA|nr:translocation/assembly module TamB domain-containing protein [Deinococcus sp. SL84]MCY1702841.1 translocation/assembly module TamB domain-containing protein [Deinococcus sp. SL84]